MTKYQIRMGQNGLWGIYVPDTEIMIAEFKRGCQIDAMYIRQALGAAPELLAALQEILDDARSSLPVDGMYPNLEAFYRAKVNRIARIANIAMAHTRADSSEEVEM